MHLLSFAPEETGPPHRWTDWRASGRAAKDYRYGPSDRLRALVLHRSAFSLFLAGRSRTRYVREVIDRVRPDLILVNQLPPLACLPLEWTGPVVLDTHNAEGERLRRRSEEHGNPVLDRAFRSQAMLADAFERRMAARMDTVLAVSGADASYFAERGGRTAVVPNGATLDGGPVRQPARPDGPVRLLFLGSLGYSANRLGLTEFIRQWGPALRMPWTLDIVGTGDPGNGLRRLVDSDERVRVVGLVDDVGREYRAHDALIVPLREGGGTRLKVLEAAAARLPVLSTEVGVEGLGLVDGVGYLRVEDAASADRALASLGDTAAVSRMTDAAFEQIRSFDWDAIAAALRLVLEEAIERHRPGTGADAAAPERELVRGGSTRLATEPPVAARRDRGTAAMPHAVHDRASTRSLPAPPASTT